MKTTTPARRTNALSTLSATLLLLIPGSVAQLAGAQEVIDPNFRDTDIRVVIEAVQAATGKNFLVDPRITSSNAKVNLYAEDTMTPAEFYSAFLNILSINQFQAIEAGNIVRIVPIAQTRQEPSSYRTAVPDELQTTVIRLKNVPAAQLVPLLRPLLPAHAHLAAQPSSNALIISDTGRNIARIRYLIRQIDLPVESDVEQVRLANASATDVVTTVNALYAQNRADAAAAGNTVNVVADVRTNSVLISGPEGSRLKVRTIIANLDTPQEAGGLTQVRYLRYANAEELATKLSGQVAEAAAGPQGGAQGAQGGPNTQATNIWADERTNALIMTAPQSIMAELMSVIDKLDVRRVQSLYPA